MSGGILERGDIVRGDIVLGGYCPGGYCPGDIVRGDIVLGGYCPGGYCPRTIKPINQRVVDEGVAKLENLLTDIYTWMSQNKLKLKADKTGVLVMGTPRMRAKISIPSITVNGLIVPVLNEPVGNLGAVFDPNMNISAYVSKGIKSANYHLRNIWKIRKFLNTDTTKSAIVLLVTSRLDYCNRLLCGITDELLCRLQKVQNNAARVVSGSKKCDHITPVLKDLHFKDVPLYT